MPDPVISVIIPCYNQAHFLPQALDSVLAQTYPHVEVIIVDDGSPDDVAAAAAPYLTDPRIHLVGQPNSGVSAARNRGVAESSGAYVQFLDADDWLHSEKLARQVSVLEADHSLSFTYCDFIPVVNGEEILDGWQASHVPGTDEPDLFDTLWISNRMTLASVLLRRQAFECAGGFASSSLTEDYELWLRLSALGHRACYIPEKLVYYRTHDMGRSNDGRARTRRVAARTAIASRFPERVGLAAEHAREVLEHGEIERDDRIATVMQQLERAEDEADQLQAQLATFEQRLSEVEAEHDALSAERDTLLTERDQLRAHLDWLEQQYRGLSERIALIERSRLFLLLRLARRHLRRLLGKAGPTAQRTH